MSFTHEDKPLSETHILYVRNLSLKFCQSEEQDDIKLDLIVDFHVIEIPCRRQIKSGRNLSQVVGRNVSEIQDSDCHGWRTGCARRT